MLLYIIFEMDAIAEGHEGIANENGLTEHPTQNKKLKWNLPHMLVTQIYFLNFSIASMVLETLV